MSWTVMPLIYFSFSNIALMCKWPTFSPSRSLHTRAFILINALCLCGVGADL